jgi:hypothetical protein
MKLAGVNILGGEANTIARARRAARGASLIEGAVVRRDGRQALRFGRFKQPSAVDAEGCEAVSMGVRSRQVYRI